MRPLPFSTAWNIVRELPPPGSWRARLHVLGRFLSCPFLPVVSALPNAGKVLDVGAGHGIFAHLAAASGAAEVVALEPDRRKVLDRAQRGASRNPVVRVVCGYVDAIAGHFAAVSMLDVLYRVPLSQWDALLTQLFERLEPGGLLLLKEIDPSHRVKGGINRLQERLADGVGLTLGDAFSYEPPAVLRARLERLGFVDIAIRSLGRWYPHAHVLYVARRPDATRAASVVDAAPVRQDRGV